MQTSARIILLNGLMVSNMARVGGAQPAICIAEADERLPRDTVNFNPSLKPCPQKLTIP